MSPGPSKDGKTCWSLERKLGLTAWVYIASILINVVISSACLLIYFRPAFRTSDAAFQQQQRLEQVRAMVRQHRSRLEEPGQTEAAAGLIDADGALSEALDEAIGGAVNPTVYPDQTATSLREAVARLRSPDMRSPAERLDSLALLELRLTEAIGQLADRRDSSLGRASRAQQWVTGILATNSVIGAALCVAGLWYVRRWVVQPASILKQAAGRIRQGDFAPRVALPCDDEMGELGRELIEMAGQIRRLQGQLVDRERLVAAGDMIDRVESHVRGPLDVIREAAAASLGRSGSDLELAGCQDRIVATVERFEAWLAQLKTGLRTATGERVPTDLSALLGRVSTAVRPALDRQGVTLVIEAKQNLPKVDLDPLPFEHAVISLVTNAVQASASGQTVTVQTALDRETVGAILVEIIDRGAGIPENLIDRIFAPFFTTKPEGTGIGLGLAKSIIQNSGGELSVTSAVGNGSCFTIRLPLQSPVSGPEPSWAARDFDDRPKPADANRQAPSEPRPPQDS